MATSDTTSDTVYDMVFATLTTKVIAELKAKNAEQRKLNKSDFSDKELLVLSKINFSDFRGYIKSAGDTSRHQLNKILNRIKSWAHDILNHAAIYQRYALKVKHIKTELYNVYQRQRMIVTFTYKYSGKIERLQVVGG